MPGYCPAFGGLFGAGTTVVSNFCGPPAPVPPRLSLGVYSEDLTIPLSAFAAGLGDHRINTALCPGGKERMRRLMNVVAASRIDLGVMVTHEYKLDDIGAAYELFANQRDGGLKVAIKPN